MNVAFPIIFVVLFVEFENITPDAFAPAVRPVESINNGSVVVDQLMTGEVLPTRNTPLEPTGRLPLLTEHDAYHLRIPYQAFYLLHQEQ